ncbi:MAG: DUF805 domain-containing protein [Kiritimatiellales bacterium]
MGDVLYYKKFESNSFLCPSRIGRVEYFLRNIGLGLIMTPFELIMEKSDNAAVSFVSFLIFVSLLVFGFWFSLLPRIRDVGWNQKLAWLMLIPGINIIFGVSLFATPGK